MAGSAGARVLRKAHSLSWWELGQVQVQDFLCPLQVLSCLLLHTLLAGR